MVDKTVITEQSDYNKYEIERGFVMLEKIKEMIVNEVGVDAELITPEASFKEDLQIDSLDLFELIMTFEEEFDIEIPSGDLEKITTVGELVNYVENLKAE